MKIIEKKTWNRHSLTRWEIRSTTDRLLSFLTLLPADTGQNLPWIVALHGYGSRKEEWLEMDGYTKGGNLVDQLVGSGYAVVLVDMDLHGENVPSGQTVDYTGLIDDRAGWSAFFARTVENVQAVMDAVLKSGQFDANRMGYLSYSLGALYGFWLANRGAAFKCMTVCVPPVLRELDNPFVIKNNLSHLNSLPVLFIAGQQDDHIPFGDTRWLFEQMPMADKCFLSYPCGHSLPLDYVPEAAHWIRERL